MENKSNKYIAMQYCPLCGCDSVKTINNIHAVWRALPVYKCEKCYLRFSVRKHDTDIDIDLD
jgi:transposase-like protein